MVRLLTWNGSAWADTRVWSGSQWKSYVPPVYGANSMREDFSGIPAGWTGSGYDGYTLQNWNNIHVYVDGQSSAYSSLGMSITSNSVINFSAEPGKTIRSQASVLIQHIAGSALPSNGKLNMSIGITIPEISYTTTYLAPTQVLTGTAGYGWVTLTSANSYSLPARSTNKPYDVELDYRHVHFWPETGALGPYGTFRMFVDWMRLIDQNGNQLMKLTTPAVEPLKVWNGAAWV